MDRTDKTYNFDGVVTTSLKLQRRGLQEVFYEYSRREGYRETGIGINEDYDKLESLLSFNRPRSLSQFTDCHPISYEDIQKFSAHLTPKQQLFLSKLPNNGCYTEYLLLMENLLMNIKQKKIKKKKMNYLK